MGTRKVQITPRDLGFQAYLNVAKETVDSELKTLKSIVAPLRLQKLINYVLQTRGKRLRPALVLISGESVGGDRRDLRKLALAIELLHSATLVHDDILDGDLFRRNVMSVQAKWSIKEAVLVGDALASIAIGLCRNYRKEILDVFTNTCLQLSDGEYMDVEPTAATASEEYYLEKIRKKSASLFKASSACGALAGNGSPAEVHALAAFGENYGMAFQIRDDLEDLTWAEGKAALGLSGVRGTLPIIHLYKTAQETAEELLCELESAEKNRFLDKQAFLGELRVKLERSGSIDYCVKKLNGYVDAAIEAQASLKESVYKRYLVQMAESLRL
jgi:octaprenyl-diphosphate synthase